MRFLASLIALAGLMPGNRSVKPRRERLAVTHTHIPSGCSGVLAANASPRAGWWTAGQPEHSKEYYIKRALTKRHWCSLRPNPSAYSLRNAPAL